MTRDGKRNPSRHRIVMKTRMLRGTSNSNRFVTIFALSNSKNKIVVSTTNTKELIMFIAIVVLKRLELTLKMLVVAGSLKTVPRRKYKKYKNTLKMIWITIKFRTTVASRVMKRIIIVMRIREE
jgi:hypothetical protein